jgi:endonuclease YncB( thermonuclease family)
MCRVMKSLLVALVLMLMGLQGVDANTLTGKVIRVADGDTITVLDSTNGQHRVRLLGIDAPERKEPFHDRSKQALSKMVMGKQVRVEWEKLDYWRRILGHVYVGSQWINFEMVATGWAGHFKKYSKDQKLAGAEVEARKKRLGMWKEFSPTKD